MFNLVDAMPLTPAGKLDRRALRDIEVHLTAPDGGDERPASETERTIGDIFAETLGLPAVGLFVSFFELGGHSLLAAKLVTRIRDELGVVVPVRALFEEPTVAGLAAAVEAARLTPTTGGHDTAMRSLVDQISDDQVDALLRSVFGDP
jgi:acyl carrier protein